MKYEQDLIRYFKTKDRLATRKDKISRQVSHCVKNMKDGEKRLSSEQLRKVYDYWSKVSFAYKVNPQWHQMYTNKTGKFSEKYIPNEFHYYFVENNLINYDYLRGFVDKNYFSLLFAGIKQPRTVVKKVFGYYYNADFEPITETQAVALVRENAKEGVVIKPSNNSWGGRNISFLKKDDATEAEVKKLFKDYGSNFIMQGVLKQHPDLAAIHKESVNTIRIITILFHGKLHFLSACLRMGRGTTQVDNFSQGGVACGIGPDGRLNEVGYDRFGNLVPRHPDGFVFRDCVVPSFEKVKETIKKAAVRVPQFGVASWDFAVDEEGDPVFIEYNIGQAGVDIHQFNNGPVYGELTDELLDYVARNYCVEDTTLSYNYNVFHDHCTVKTASKIMRKIRVKKMHHNLPVTRIGHNAFEGAEVKTVCLPETVKALDYCAFYRCEKLEKIKLSRGLETIGRSAFNGCKNLRKVVLPDTVTMVGIYAFRDVEKLEIYMPESVIDIADNAFEGCEVVIHGKSGSYAEAYAKKQKITFVTG